MQVSPCFDFLKDLLETLLAKKASSLVAPDKQLQAPYTAPGFTEPPARRSDINFTHYSWVLQHKLACYPSAPCQYSSPSSCPAGDKAWEHKTLTAGQEPPPTWQQAQQQELERQRIAEQEAREAADRAAAAKKEEAQRTAAAAAAAAAAAGSNVGPSEAARTVVHAEEGGGVSGGQQVGGFVGQGVGVGVDMQDNASVRDEAVQQRQRRAFIGQAASWGTVICIAGLLGLVVLWQMRAASSGAGGGRRWPRYAPLQRRPPSPSPQERMV